MYFPIIIRTYITLAGVAHRFWTISSHFLYFLTTFLICCSLWDFLCVQRSNEINDSWKHFVYLLAAELVKLYLNQRYWNLKRHSSILRSRSSFLVISPLCKNETDLEKHSFRPLLFLLLELVLRDAMERSR